MTRRRYLCFLAVLTAVSTPALASTLVITGPALLFNVVNWDNSGLQITALANVTLESFVFNNQGAADTIWLTDAAGSVLQTYIYGGGEAAHLATVGWSMLAGTTYHLISDDPSNGRYTSYIGNRISNAHLRVDGAWGMGALQSSAWFHFTNLTTTDTVIAEPGTLVLVAAGLAACRLRRRRFGRN